MSNINTNGINASYPVPGVNNSTQGFRDNFTSIKTNLSTAGEEISDLQQKVVVKSALNGTAINNDMANTLISNAAIKSFRATTYNMGNSLPSTILVDVSKGDVQYGTIVQDTIINFAGWAPSGTQSNVQLNLTISNSSATIRFPDTYYNASNIVISGMRGSSRLLENFISNSSPAANAICTNQVTIPAEVSELQYKLSTTDCGSTLDIEPINRNQIAGRISLRIPSAIGTLGDFPGAICTDGDNLYICAGQYDGTTHIWKKVTLTSVS